MIQNILYNVVLGAAAGYITNDSAINMLFDEKGIGKLKVGGVVVKTRKEFEDKISSLVESEIVNQENLKKSLENEEFFKTMKTLFSKYFNEELSLSIGDREFLDLNNFSITEENILRYIRNSKENISKKIVEGVGESLELKDLIGEEQAVSISQNIFNEIFQVAKKEEIIEGYLLDVYKEIQSKNLLDITTKEPVYVLSEEISKRVPDLILFLKDRRDSELNKILNNILRNSKITAEFENFENTLKERSIEDILGPEKTKKLQKQILNLLKEYINSSKGYRNLENISQGILDYLKELDVSILDFMNQDVRESFYQFTKSKLPKIIEQIIRWVRKNDRKIEDAIEDSINEVIDESGFIKENILRVIKKNLGNVTKRYGLVGKIIERIQRSKDDEELAKSFTKELIEYLEDTKIGDIINSMDMINSKEIANFIKQNLDKALENTSSYMIPLDKVKMENLLPENLTEILDRYMGNEFINIKDNYLYSDRYIGILQKEIKDKILNLKDRKINELLESEKYEEIVRSLSSELYNVIESKKQEVTEGISMEFYRGIKGKKMDELISEEIKNTLTEKVHGELINRCENTAYNLERSKIDDYLEKLKQIESIDDKATNMFIDGLIENLPLLMEGNIKSLVQENLVNLDNDELKEMMREFMGKELKPLNVMGAVLGGVTGGILGTVDSKVDIPLLANMVTYATIGVLTNCIAIYGIFKPYEPNKVLKMMTLGKLDTGVIPKQKEQFARNMSKFVEKKLLNKDFLEFTVREKKESLKETILKEIGKKKEKLIDKNLDDNDEMILDYIINKSSEFILENKEMLSNMLINDLDKLYIDELGIAEFKERLKKIKISNKEGAQIVVQREVKNFLLGDCKIKTLINKDEIQKSLENNMSIYIEKFIDSKLNSELLLKELNKKLREYDSYLNKNLDEVLDTDEIFESIKNRMLDYDKIIQFIYSKVDELFKREFKESKKVGDLFNGKLISFISGNTENLSRNIVNKIQNEIYNNESSLKSYCVNELHDYLYDGEGVIGGFKNLFKKAVNSAIGGDELVRTIVGKSISKTVRIIDESQYEIKMMFHELLDDLEKTKVSSFGLKLDSNETENIIEKVVRNREFQNIFEGSCRGIIEFAFEKNIKSYLNMIDIRSFNDIVLMFREDLLKVFDNGRELFKENYEESFVQPLCDIVADLVQENILESKMKDIFNNLNDGDIDSISNRIYSSLIETEAFNNSYIRLVDESLSSLENKKISTIVNFDILERDIQEAIKNILGDSKVLYRIYSKDGLIIENIKNILKNIDQETLNNGLEIVLNPFIKVGVENVGDIFDSLKISRLTYTEIANMENSKLHEMFDSFAGKYFKKLKMYGVWGGIFAVPYLNYSLIGYSGFKMINDKKRNKESVIEQEFELSEER